MNATRLRRFPAAARARLHGPWSLRSRLLAAVVSLSLIAIVVVSAVTFFSLGSYLRDRQDKQLVQNFQSAVAGLGAPDTNNPRFGFSDRDALVTAYSTSGQEVLPATGAKLPFVTPSLTNAQPQTVHASNRVRYRVVAMLVRGRDSDGSFIALAVIYGLPTSQVTDVLQRLLLLELAVGGGAIVLLFLIGTALVRVGLRPLDRIGQTAGHIAAGDLSQRITTTSPRTEVGRLGVALNAMLTQIEGEITQRTASEERLRRFIADASHELRTPLTSIRGYAELFRRGAASRPDDLALAMRRIEAESGRMGGLVEDLLLLARLDEGRPLERTPVDLALLAADTGADARALAPDRTVEVTVEGDTTIRGDDARLRQVLANLVRNVLAHTPPGTPFGLRVRGGSDTVTVEVWDRGPGLARDEAAKVFDRFWRSDPSRQREHSLSGSGLGLSIVAALTAAHDGVVAADPTPGGGATFRIVIPRTDPVARPTGVPAEHGEPGGPVGSVVPVDITASAS